MPIARASPDQRRARGAREMVAARRNTVRGADRDALAAAIWRETYRHDTLFSWHEVKRGTMHHKRVLAAADAVIALAQGIVTRQDENPQGIHERDDAP